ncbi:serine O-acetyltransferase [Desulfopila sp. IMCC35008]|uniref:serine O-acetyltransferase n=1 Tax=Desulfopila sp. IMCC35008 TaxID=2653858 RepID=UPI0013D08659|nr:serine acetyltransferase [Desulfopila sp. IMCC35008]
MIQSKKDYLKYLAADSVALGINISSFREKLNEFVYPNPIWGFQKNLRKLEYYYNCKKGFIGKLFYYYLLHKFRRKSISLGFSIPENVFGPGLAIVHYGTIVVHHKARIGKNCRIHANVNIGASGGSPQAPQIGDNVYIGPGSVIYGDIKIGNNVAISANSTVNKTFDENNILIAGSPAKKIKEYDISKIIEHAGENL